MSLFVFRIQIQIYYEVINGVSDNLKGLFFWRGETVPSRI